jgi:type I restriction enzyme S subunit
MPYVGMDQVESHTMRLLGTVPASTMKSTAIRFLPGDVLYGRLRPYLNKVVSPDFEGMASAEFIPLTPASGIETAFVRLRVSAADFVEFASHLDEGDRPRVDWDGISAFPCLLPPTNEQRRIVDALDSYLSRLDAALATLHAAQTKLRAYRTSVLKAAVEGRLVPTEAALARAEKRDFEPGGELLKRILAERRSRWEKAELAKLTAAGKSPNNERWKARYEEPRPPGTMDLPELPEGWCWARAEQVSEFITKGTTPQAELMTPDQGDIPYIKVYNLTFNGGLDFATDPTFVARDVHGGELARSRCCPGDVLMNIVGPPLGKVSIVPPTFDEWNINQAIARYRPIELHSRYLAYVLLSGPIQRWAFQRAKATAGQFNLTLEIARDLPIPLAPLAEQDRIVDALEQALSAEAATKLSVATDAKRCARLRQAVLKWAFEGKLVDQDPNDEPAEKLLKHIRAQRATTDRPKRTRRARAAQ